jgi:hypothetical protein
MTMRRLLTITFASLLLSSATRADVGLTIYSSADPAGFDPQQFIAQNRQGYDANSAWQVPGFGVVRDSRTLDLQPGIQDVPFTDVAQFIDPTTVSLVDLSKGDPLTVLEQTFKFDLVSPDKLLEKYLDQTITVNVPRGDEVEKVTGKLLSANQGRLVLMTDKGLRIAPGSGDVQLGELPAGLLTKPTLVWKLNAPAAGQRQVRTTYQTDGITWRADYNLILNAQDTAADLGAWVTIMNLSGATYADANLKLIAGDVQRIQPPQTLMGRRRGVPTFSLEEALVAPGFQEKSFFEYHLYTLPRKTTIADNATQQIALFPTVSDVKVNKVLVYYGLPDASHWVFPSPQIDRDLGNDSNKKVDVYIRFDNKENNRLGIPLPKGKVRVFKKDDADGALEFIGEDVIDHTPKNQTVLVKIGQSFDVTGQRTITDFKSSADARRDAVAKGDWIEETIRITLKNAKDQAQDVIVKENLYRWVNWEIIKHSDDFTKIDARTIHFDAAVPAEGEKTLEYTVRYTW